MKANESFNRAYESTYEFWQDLLLIDQFSISWSF
jgi:hypothetical protein